VTRELRLNGAEVSDSKHVDIPISINIVGSKCKNREHLNVGRKVNHFKAIAGIHQAYRREQICVFSDERLIVRIKNVFELYRRIIFIAKVFSLKERDLSYQLVTRSKRMSFSSVVVCEDMVKASIVVKVACKQAHRSLGRCPKPRVQAEVACEYIHVAVPIEINKMKRIPPSIRSGKSVSLRLIFENTGFRLNKQRKWHPLAGKEEIGPLVAIDIHPYSIGHPAHELPGTSRDKPICRIREPTRSIVDEQVTACISSIGSRYQPPSDENIEISIAVNVSRPHARRVDEQSLH